MGPRRRGKFLEMRWDETRGERKRSKILRRVDWSNRGTESVNHAVGSSLFIPSFLSPSDIVQPIPLKREPKIKGKRFLKCKTDRRNEGLWLLLLDLLWWTDLAAPCGSRLTLWSTHTYKGSGLLSFLSFSLTTALRPLRWLRVRHTCSVVGSDRGPRGIHMSFANTELVVFGPSSSLRILPEIPGTL